VLRRYTTFLILLGKYTHHRTRFASVCDRKKSCGSGSADWWVHSPHISELHLQCTYACFHGT